MKLFLQIILLSVVGISSGFAQEPVCQERIEKGGSIQLHMLPTNKGECFITIHNFKSRGLVYRDYLFTSDGDFMVFNSYGPGEDSTTTGSREFYMFPRPLPMPQYVWNEEKRRLEVTSVAGNVFSFDYENAELVEITGAKTLVAKDVVSNNKGGVEIKSYQGLLLDIGFTIGKSPSENPKVKSLFTDKNGKTCKVLNDDLFSYVDNGNVIFKHSDKSLEALLASKCPLLKFK